MQNKIHLASSFAAFALVVTPAHSGMLLDCYDLASKNDLTLQAARFQRDAEREAKPQALAAILPQVTAQATVLENRFDVLSLKQDNNQYAVTKESYPSKSYSVTLKQAIFDWNAFKSVAAADSAVAQAEASYRAAEQDLMLRVTSAYLNVLAAEDTLRADLDAQAAFKLQYEQQSGRYKAGLSAVADVSNSKAAMDSSAATIISDTVAVNAAKRALATLIGVPVQSLASLRDEINLAPPSPASADSWSASAARDNLDVMTARYAAEAAKNRVAAAGGRRLPTLSAVGSTSRDDSDSRFGSETQTDYIGLSLNWDLYRGGQIASVVRQAESTADQADTLYQLQLRKTDQAVRDHYEAVVSGIESVKASASAVASQQASVVATEVGFKVGTRTIIDTLNTRQNLVAAQKAQSQARYNYLVSLLRLKSDVGQLAMADIRDLDRLLNSPTAPAAAAP